MPPEAGSWLYEALIAKLFLDKLPIRKHVDQLGLMAYVVDMAVAHLVDRAVRLVFRYLADFRPNQNIGVARHETGRDPIFAKTMWDDTVNQVCSMTEQMRRGNPDAPTEKEINEGLIEVRRARGITGRTGQVLLNSNALQKVGFDKK